MANICQRSRNQKQINIQVVTREAAAETMAEEPSVAEIPEEDTSSAEEETTMEVVVAGN